MKLLITSLLLLALTKGFSQITDTIRVSRDHTAYLIFDDDVKANKGNQEIEIIESGNKIGVMGKDIDFYETNLLVTMGNTLYMFIIQYDEHPTQFIFNYQNHSEENITDKKKNISIDYSGVKKERAKKQKTDSLKKIYFNIEEKMKLKEQNTHNLYLNHYNFIGIITNIYADGDYIVLKLFIENKSNIKYDVDFLGFKVTTKKKSFLKKGATESYSINKLYPFKEDDLKVLEPNSKKEMVYIFEKFTIEKKKKLTFQITELKGDRKLSIDVPHQYIIKADSL